MNQRLNKFAVAGLSALALAVGGASTPAEAAFQAYICGTIDCSNAATTLIVTDGGAGDGSAGANGVIISTFSFGGLTVLVNTSQSKPAIGSAGAPQLDITFTVTGIGTAYMYASDTGFTGVGTLHSLFNGNQTAGGGAFVQEGIFGGTTNTNPVAGGLPGNFLAAGALLSTASFSESLSTGVVGSAVNPYMLTIGVIINRVAAGTTTGDLNVNVPEPASLALLGIGLAAAGFAGRRREA